MKSIYVILFASFIFVNAVSTEIASNHKGITPKGEFIVINEKNYYIETTPATWFEGQSFCASINMKLLSLETEAKDQEISLYLSENALSETNIWTSGSKRSDMWVWTNTGEEFTYDRWYPEEPNDSSWEICVNFQGRHGWFDFDCYYPYAYMCQE